MQADPCPRCGANLAMVGKAHRCNPVTLPVTHASPSPAKASPSPVTLPSPSPPATVEPSPSPSKPRSGAGRSKAWKLRNPDKVRVMRKAYKARRRAKAQATKESST